MKILVDADACPVKNIIMHVAKEIGLPVILFVDTSHILEDDYATVITVGQGQDSVDFALMNQTVTDDVVVTQDYGLAAMVLGKKAKAIHPNGMIYNADNMDQLLLERHIGQKNRRSGKRTKGPKKRTRTDDTAFETAFRKVLLWNSI